MADCSLQVLGSISVEPPTGVNQSGASARSVELRSKGIINVLLHLVSYCF